MAKITVLLLCVTFIAVNAQTHTKQCRGFRKLNNDEVSLSNCQKGICKLKRGRPVEVILKFTPDRDIKSLTTNVEANINGLQIPWIGIDGASACSNIYDENDQKIEECEGEKCQLMCKFENLKLLPGTEEVNDGKCRKVRCNADFSLVIKYCLPTSTFDKCKKVKDTSKIPFPECCDVCTS
ncbi:hypothetical protein PVAND_002457 [Polypedilum vanderplanki]|uniref:Single domain-containing protein n=1 Tax=Polypedilum vanderplanki TaxID=319348 RepID=A0A9J6BS82_POLVA|nr:hypothetical protein PVAND_002457 [Polypedilum vanderplanki]